MRSLYEKPACGCLFVETSRPGFLVKGGNIDAFSMRFLGILLAYLDRPSLTESTQLLHRTLLGATFILQHKHIFSFGERINTYILETNNQHFSLGSP